MILNTILSLLLSYCGFSFALGHRVSFYGGIRDSPVDGCSAASCNFGALPGGDEHTSFYSTILNQVEICNLPEKEFRIVLVKMIQDLEKRMEKMQKIFTKDLKELKNKQTEMNNVLEGINSRVTEA